MKRRGHSIPVAQWMLGLGEGGDLRRIANFLGSNRWRIPVLLILAIAEGLVEASILTLIAAIALAVVGVSVAGDVATKIPLFPGIELDVRASIIILLVLILVRILLGVAAAFLGGTLQMILISEFRSKSMQLYLSASWEAQRSFEHGALQQLVISLPNSMSGTLGALVQHCSQVVIMLAMLTYAAVINFVLTAFLVVVLLLITFIFSPLRNWIRKRAAVVVRKEEELASLAAEVSGISTELHAFQIGEAVGAHATQLVREEAAVSRKIHFAKKVVSPLYTGVTFAGIAVGLVVISATGADSVGSVGGILLVVLRSINYGQSVQQIAVDFASLGPMFDYVSTAAERLVRAPSVWGTEAVSAIEVIELVGVGFSYLDAPREAVTSTNLKFGIGERIGLVGTSGSGKSTLANIVLGLTEPSIGEVRLNGRLRTDYSIESWRKRVGFVPQSAGLIRGSVEDNVRMFREGIGVDDIWLALELAGLAADVRQLPDGLGTYLGPGAQGLSGGQSQRIAIARAFVGNPDLVVMDEPTSALDAQSEGVVSESIENLSHRAAILIISHRERILRSCNRIIVVEAGRIVAERMPNEFRMSLTRDEASD